MKTGLMNLGTTAGLLLLVALQPRSIHAQTAPSLVTVTTNAPAAPSTSAPTPFVLRPVGIVKELEKLMQSGTEPGVIRAFIQSWPTPYSVTADDILRLHGEGLPSDVLTVLIQH